MTPSDAQTRVLIVEDDPDDFQIVSELLAEIPGTPIRLEWARDFEAGRAALAAAAHDAYLLDYRLGKHTGLDLLAQAVAMGCGAPLIFVTGEGDRELGLRALAAGAADFLIKGQFDAGVLERSIRYGIERTGHTRDLEHRVRERTTDLERSNAQLRQSEQFSRTVFESSTDCVKVLDVDGHMVSLNTSGMCLMEIDDFSQFKGRQWGCMWPADVQDRINAALTVAKTGGTDRFQAFCPTAKGTPKWWEVTVSPVRQGDGPVTMILSVSRDITDRRRVEETAALLAAIVASSEDAIISKDLNGFITSWNLGAQHLFGYTAQEAIGKHITMLIPEDHINEEPRIIERIRRGESVEHYETVRRRKDGARLDISLTVSPLRVSGGRIVGASKIARNITERKRVEAQFQEAKSRLESTLAAGDVGTWEFDVVNDIVRADANLAAMFGVSADQATGAPVSVYLRAIHDDDRPAVKRTIQQAILAGERYDAEYRLVRPDGSHRWVIARGRVERDTAGRAVRLPGVVVDITAQREAENELRETQRRWRLALEAAELGSWNIDPAASTLETDERFRVIFHGSPAPISYDQAFAAIHPDDLDRVREKVADATRPDNPAAYSEEYRVVHRDGKVLWVLGKGRASFEATPTGRRLISFDGTVSDITEQRALKQRLDQQAQHIAEESRRKDEFLAMLSHELRNPLAPIRAAVHLLRAREADTGDAIGRQAREIIERQVANLTRLVSDLLEVSRVLSGRIRLDRRVVDLNQIIRDAAETAAPLVQEHRHELLIHSPPEPVWTSADATRIEEVFINLLNNAAKYTLDGGRIQVWCEPEAHAGHAIVRVRDTGVGIEPGLLPRIFDLFTQADRSLARSVGGLGIGLSLARRIVELHGGTIEAASPPPGAPVGSEFTVRLCLADAPPVSPAAQAGTPPHIRGLRVLLVDDNVDLVVMLSAALRHEGHTVQVAHTGPDGLEIAHQWRPDLTILDIGLPGLDGYEVARQLRAAHDAGASGPPMRLIALTGYGRERDIQAARDAGFDAHMTKPIEVQDLQRTIARVTA